MIQRFLVNLLSASWQSLRWIVLQFTVWSAAEFALGLLGMRSSGGIQSAMHGLALMMCIVGYTTLFCFHARFVPRRLWRKTLPCLYLFYCLLVYLAILSDGYNNWDVSHVTIDSYMIEGWLAPLYGIGCLFTVRVVKYYLKMHELYVIGKVLHSGLNTLTILSLSLSLFVFIILAIQHMTAA